MDSQEAEVPVCVWKKQAMSNNTIMHYKYIKYNFVIKNQFRSEWQNNIAANCYGNQSQNILSDGIEKMDTMREKMRKSN